MLFAVLIVAAAVGVALLAGRRALVGLALVVLVLLGSAGLASAGSHHDGTRVGSQPAGTRVG